MRVLLATSLHGGGPVEHALTLAQALTAAGVEVEASCGDSELAERFAAAGAVPHVLPLERSADPGGAKKLSELAREVDVVHAQDRRTGLLTRLWRPDGTPRVYTVHGLPDPYLPIPANRGRRPGLRNQLAYRGLDAWLARRSDALVVASQALAEQLRRRLRFPAARMEVIPNGVEPVAATEGGDLVASISMLEPVKGLDAFVRATAEIGDVEGTRFQIVGSGGAAEDLRELAAELGAPIEFPGHVPAPELLPRLRIFVLTSWFENCPMALLEAMMAGVPAVVTGVGGVPELVADTALVVPPGDPGALAAALGRLFEDPGLAADLGRRSRARALANFTAERNARRLIDLYERNA
ncbi:MAG TPA: glycosyltransferase family 4 protein [Solirubrobacterales bacterium]|nr:glycosyltransferase family 4 protein [Solirubrobacterales bacterium]